MAGSFKKLYQGNPTTETPMYTAPASTKTLVRQIVVCNTTGSNHTVSIGLVPAGQTADGTHRVLSGKSVPANDTLVLDIFQVLHAADFISGLVSDAGMTVTISGVEGVA